MLPEGYGDFMEEHLTLLLTGKSKRELDRIAKLLPSKTEMKVVLRLMNEGQADPLYNLPKLPDALILSLSGDWEMELKALSARPLAERPPLLIIGPVGEARMMRMAMQAGARDFFAHPLEEAELVAAVERLLQDIVTAGDPFIGKITSVINAKGGSGASILAASMAHILTVKGGLTTALLDIDLQFGVLPQYFDLQANNGLLQSIDSLEALDATAVEGYMLKHHSGLHVLGNSPEQAVLPGAEEIPTAEARVGKLLDLLTRRYEHIVVDLPRQIDPFTSVFLRYSDQVLIVLQQSLAHLRDTQRLLLFMQELAIQSSRIKIVVNRYDKNLPVTLRDIEKAVNQRCFMTLPNDFQRVSESVNLGVPLYERYPNARMSKALSEMAEKLSAKPFPQSKSGLFNWLRH